MDLKNYVYTYADFPKQGINFRDITPLLMSPGAFREAIERLNAETIGLQYDLILAIEARGLVIGTALSFLTYTPLAMARKPGKLPGKTYGHTYKKEYGDDGLFVQEDAVREGARVLIVDDLLAIGGTAQTAGNLVNAVGAIPVGLGVLIELTNLQGRSKLTFPTVSLIKYDQ